MKHYLDMHWKTCLQSGFLLAFYFTAPADTGLDLRELGVMTTNFISDVAFETNSMYYSMHGKDLMNTIK